KSIEFHEPSSALSPHPRTASRPRTEAGGAELSQRGLGRSAPRRRRWRLPRAGEPVRRTGRTGHDLRRRRGGEICRGPSLARAQRRVLAVAGEAVAYCFNVSRNRTGSPLEGVVTSPCHITRRPRTKVPTGQPVTSTPS